MLRRISEIVLKSRIEKDNAIRSRKFMSWDNIDKIALIVHKEQVHNKSAIDSYIARTNKHVEVFYLEPHSKEPSYGDWECFTKKDKSLLGLPKKERLNALKSRHFDIVINTCDADFFSTAISSALNAPLKCGSSGYYKDTDLIITKSEPFNLIKYLDDTVIYLKMIRQAA
jgi:hypothetical protein